MRGIKLNHGVSFIEYDGVTIRINADGTCVLSRILLPSLEWDLRTEPPETWDYIYDEDIASFGADTLEKIKQIAAEVRRITEN